MKLQRKEDAVSPVIGVMLMLVVTIIIAAVITGFATDLSADTDSTPIAFFEVDYVNIGKPVSSAPDSITEFGFKHKGGEAVLLKEIQLTYVTTGGASEGFINTPGSMSVVGKESEGTNAAVTTGDIIKVTPKTNSEDYHIEEGTTLVWTMSHTKSGGVIAKGEFIAIPM